MPVIDSIGGVISFEDKNGRIFEANIFLVTHNLAITAANNIYDRKRKQFFRNHEVMIEGEEIIKVIDYRFPEEFKNAKKSTVYNYALLKLEKSVEGRYFELGINCPILYD